MPMPRLRRGIRLPLAMQILVVLALNVLLLAVVLATVYLLQVRWNPGWLLTGRSGERIQAVAELIAGDLATSGLDDAQSVLDRYRQAYQLDFRLYADSRRLLAGPVEPLPPEIVPIVDRPRGLGLNRGARATGAGSGAGPGAGPGPRSGRGLGPPWRVGEAPGRRGAPESPIRREPYPRIVLRAGSPPAYWIVVKLPGREDSPLLNLVLRAESLWTGGLLFDSRPWLLATAGVLGLSCLFWLPFALRITRDIGRLTQRTGEIAAGRFDTRVDIRRADELGRLAESIDRMADRLATHVAGQKRFLGDAAHELCSPLARMQAAVALLEDRTSGDARAYVEDLREELDEMSALIHELLAFSRATHGRAVQREPVELRALVDRALARENQAASDVRNEVPSGLIAMADATLLLRAVSNLIRNAQRYAGDAGPISVSAQTEADRIVLTVADQGPGVPPAALPRLFEPFYRPETSRTRDRGGVGLGLAIVKTCIDACDGTVSARNRSPRGFEVVVRLPMAG